jgi:signal transduction histidine kinase
VILSNSTLLSTAAPHLAAMLEAAAAGTEGHLIAGLDAAEFRARWPEMLSAVVKGSLLIDAIIRNLRDFSADAPGQGAALLDVNAAIRSAVDLVGAYIRRATDCFTCELHLGLPRIRGNAQRLEQVFINLILNACQSIEGRDKAITVRSRPGEKNATLQVIVRDEGAGIAPEIMPRVREAFFTTRGESGGSGLGLYVSQAIVTAHGGTLELTSQPGVGTEATMTFPTEAAE